MRLFLVLLLFILLFSCDRNPISIDNNIELHKSTFVLNYDCNYDHDASFRLIDTIDNVGIIKKLELSFFNLSEDVDFKIILGNDIGKPFLFDTLYVTSKLNSHGGKISLDINNLHFNNLLVKIFRYETYKPIDIICQVIYIK